MPTDTVTRMKKTASLTVFSVTSRIARKMGKASGFLYEGNLHLDEPVVQTDALVSSIDDLVALRYRRIGRNGRKL